MQTRYGERDQALFIFTDGRHAPSFQTISFLLIFCSIVIALCIFIIISTFILKQAKVINACFISLRFKVTLWGELASSVSESFKHDLEKPVIGILTSAKLSNFRGKTSVFS